VGLEDSYLAAYDYIVANNKLDREEKEFLKNKTFYGNEIVANTQNVPDEYVLA
jgi:type I restriction enzyme M protein